jgi:hypothetical protein
VIAAAVAILKGFRIPNSWAYTQMQFDYRFGFVKRGLFGEVARLLGVPIWRYPVAAGISFAILAAFLLALWWTARESGAADPGEGALTLLFASSFALTYLMSLVGYYDILLLLFAVLVLGVRRPGPQLVCALAAGVVGVLIQEIYVIAFLPVSLLGLAARVSENRGGRPEAEAGRAKTRGEMVALGAAYVLPWALAVGLSLHRPLRPDQVSAWWKATQARADFPLNGFFLQVPSSSALSNMKLVLDRARYSTWILEQIFCALIFLPNAILLLSQAVRLTEPGERLLRWGIVFAGLSPLLLYPLGYDGPRWQALALTTSFVAYAAMCRARPAARRRLRVGAAVRHFALLLVSLNLASNLGLMAQDATDYPFFSYVLDARQYVLDHMSGEGP